MRKNYPKNMRINAEFLEFRAKHTPNLKFFLYLCTSFDKNKTINMAKKVLFINQEIDPYVAESYMSTMGRELPQKMQEAGFEIRTFMPKWGTINERRGQLHEVIRLSGMNLIIDDTDHPLIIKVASIPTTRQQIYFIDNDDYFNNRQMGVDENGVEYTDNGERAIFFARGVLETVKKLRWQPDVIICQGWASSVVPLYVKTAFAEEPSFANSKVLLALYHNELKGELGKDFKRCVDFREAKAELLDGYKEDFDFEELGKLGIDYSDGVIEAEQGVSEVLLQYAQEKGKPVMSYPGEDFSEDYKNFINEICPDE